MAAFLDAFQKRHFWVVRETLLFSVARYPFGDIRLNKNFQLSHWMTRALDHIAWGFSFIIRHRACVQFEFQLS